MALGLCSQIDLDLEVRKAARRVVQEEPAAAEEAAPESAGTLLPAEETVRPGGLIKEGDARAMREKDKEKDKEEERRLTVDDVFGTTPRGS